MKRLVSSFRRRSVATDASVAAEAVPEDQGMAMVMCMVFIILGIDAVMDMLRTAVSCFGAEDPGEDDHSRAGLQDKAEAMWRVIYERLGAAGNGRKAGDATNEFVSWGLAASGGTSSDASIAG